MLDELLDGVLQTYQLVELVVAAGVFDDELVVELRYHWFHCPVVATGVVEDELDVVGCQLIHTEVLVAAGVVEVFDDEELLLELDEVVHWTQLVWLVADGVLELEVVLELEDELDTVTGTHCEYAGTEELDDDDDEEDEEVVEIA